MQDARVFKAGNSLAVRIPGPIAKYCELEDGGTVEIAANGGMMYLRKAPSRKLHDLIERITPENMHEPMFDDNVGNEEW